MTVHDPHLPETPGAPPRRGLLARVSLHVLSLLMAGVCFVAYQHLKLQGSQLPATVSLVAAGLLAFAPVRAIIGEFFLLEGKALHLVHGIGGLVLMGLGAGGIISGSSMLTHAAMAPFALMGAAQAVMHQDHPRNPAQAAALRTFASSLPEVAQFTRGNLADPANAARAVTVLSDLIGKAEALGETELNADPAFQSALVRATTRTGLSLGLDCIEQAVNRLPMNSSVPVLKRQIAQARRILKTASPGMRNASGN